MSTGFSLFCPHCRAGYQLPAQPPVGQAFVCYQCKQNFAYTPQPVSGYQAAPNMSPVAPPAVPQGYAPPGAAPSPYVSIAPPNSGVPKWLLWTGGSVVVGVAMLFLISWAWSAVSERLSVAQDQRGTGQGTNVQGAGHGSNSAGGAVSPNNSQGPGTQDANPTGANDPSLGNPQGRTPRRAVELSKEKPEGIWTEYLAEVQKIGPILNSIVDEKSRDQAIPKINEINKRLEEVGYRAVMLAPISPREYKEFLAKHGSKLSDNVDRSQTFNKPNLVTFDLEMAVHESNSHGNLIQMSLRIAGRPLQDPKNEAEQIERTAYQAELDGLRRIITSMKSGDQQAINDEFLALASDFDALTAQKKALARSLESQAQQANGAYGQEQGLVSMLSTRVLFDLVERFGKDAPAIQNYVKYSSARSNFNFARPGEQGDQVAGRGGSRFPPGFAPPDAGGDGAPPGNGRGPGGRPGLGPGGRPGFGPGGPPDFGPGSRPGMGPGGPPVSGGPPVPGGPPAPGGPPGGFPGPGNRGFDPLRDFIKQQGAENVVRVNFSAATDQEREAAYKEIQELTRTNASQSFSTNIATTVAVRYSGDVQALSQKIKFGKVKRVDEKERLIEMEP